ncbi:DUF1700 domain-containing protein [Lacrimispora sp.]|uniref:DUF1700 domain-containing protein n=1 Tax=Lacrimispora sp. TaxID=2719234 RepID=UPI003993354E
MSREEFMRRLEYLLSDIPDEEKSDAIGYYRDYLEEAGWENEEQVIKDFGSPERIAAIIRTEISGNLEDGGEFTEKGYQDERFKDPNYQMAKRYDLPETTEEYGKRAKKERETQDTNRTAKLIIWIILIVAASPLLLGIGGGIIGLIGGLFGLFAAAVIVVGAVTFAFLVAGAALIVAGFVSMPIHPLAGTLVIGTGVMVLGLGSLGLAVSGAFYGKFLPYLFQSSVNFIQKLLYGRRSRL